VLNDVNNKEIGRPIAFSFWICSLLGVAKNKYLCFRRNVIHLEIGLSHINA